MLFDVIDQGIGQFTVSDQLVAIVTVFFMLMQVNVIDTGTAVNHGIVDNKTFQVQHAQGFTGVDRHAVYRHRQPRMLVCH
ncbi:hypothetical protein D3C78_1025130 [compost metagenome]